VNWRYIFHNNKIPPEIRIKFADKW
jgi:hypothetical protein